MSKEPGGYFPLMTAHLVANLSSAWTESEPNSKLFNLFFCQSNTIDSGFVGRAVQISRASTNTTVTFGPNHFGINLLSPGDSRTFYITTDFLLVAVDFDINLGFLLIGYRNHDFNPCLYLFKSRFRITCSSEKLLPSIHWWSVFQHRRSSQNDLRWFWSTHKIDPLVTPMSCMVAQETNVWSVISSPCSRRQCWPIFKINI